MKLLGKKELLLQFEKDNDWFESNSGCLQRAYERKFVAIQAGAVIAAKPDFPGLMAALRSGGIDPSGVLVKFVQQKNVFDIF